MSKVCAIEPHDPQFQDSCPAESPYDGHDAYETPHQRLGLGLKRDP
jgi:hypothetical protein